MGYEVRKRLILTLVALLACVCVSAQKNEQTDSLVRLMKAQYIEQLQINGRPYRKAIDATFLHNGTYFISDTALWNIDDKIINAKGNVKVIQDETILTSEKMDYLIDESLAQFRGTLVQLQNRKRNLLRTRHLDYNTKDSVAVFKNGASMRDQDGQVIESTSGNYSTSLKTFSFVDNVNMFTDSVFVKTRELYYESERNLANFNAPIDFWKGGNMLSADRGQYYRDAELFCFFGNVHGMTQDQENWCDTLYFYRNKNNVLMYGNVQLTDTTRSVNALSNYLFYEDTTSTVTLKRDAAVAMRTTQDDKVDTLYMGADLLRYNTRMRFQIDEAEVKDAEGRLTEMHVDPVTEYRQKAAKARAEAAAAAENPDGKNGKAAPGSQGAGAGKAAKPADSSPKKDSKAAKPEKGAVKAAMAEFFSSRKAARGKGGKTDMAAAPSDSTAASPDSAARIASPAPLDSAAARAVSAAPLDSAARAASPAPLDSAAARAARVDSLSNRLGEFVDSLTGRSRIKDSLAVRGTAAVRDSLALRDTLASKDAPVLRDSLALRDSASVPDSLALRDSLSVSDSLPPLPDSTKVAFMLASGNVKIYRKDLQIRCDSLRYTELDSIARFYKNPVIWNDGNRQYSSDSLYVLVSGGGVDRASLQSNAFVIIQEDSLSFDQIKGTEIMAYFDSTSALRRFDALGGANALFYLQENDAFATINKVECKMLSALLAAGEIDMVYYFDAPHNNAYPVVQLPKDEQRMKGFNWQPENRPKGREDITSLELRPSERSAYLRKPRARFDQTQIYFPGYMPGILREIAVRDSLSKLPPSASAAAGDTLEVRSRDSLNLRNIRMPGDSIAVNEGAEPIDSIVTAPVPAPADSLASKTADDPLAVPTLDPKQQRREQMEQARALRQAARDAKAAEREKRWAELDARDAAKAAAKAQKALEKKRAKTLKLVKARLKQEARDEAKLQYYIKKYSKQKANDERRKQKSGTAGKRTPRVERGRELSAPDDVQPVSEGGDAVLGNPGSADDGAVLGGGSLPGA